MIQKGKIAMDEIAEYFQELPEGQAIRDIMTKLRPILFCKMTN